MEQNFQHVSVSVLIDGCVWWRIWSINDIKIQLKMISWIYDHSGIIWVVFTFRGWGWWFHTGRVEWCQFGIVHRRGIRYNRRLFCKHGFQKMGCTWRVLLKSLGSWVHECQNLFHQTSEIRLQTTSFYRPSVETQHLCGKSNTTPTQFKKENVL